MDYQQLYQRTRSIGLDTGPSENHGIFCGLLCGGHPDAETLWVSELLQDCDPLDLRVRDCAEGFRALAEETREDIERPGLGFKPCLPGDTNPMVDRASSLRDWCQGFLYSLALSGTHEHHLSEITMEALGDLSHIAQLDDQALSGSEQEEDAYSELTEFVWVAAMLIYEERARTGVLA